MKIGVFDSGVGGLSVANKIKKDLPDHDILLREDKANLPYGTKTPDELLTLVAPIFKDMEAEGCDVIVVACNTVTTNIISELREISTVPLIGMEPMVKPAAGMTHTGKIAVFATPATLKSKRYQWLKSEYCDGIAVLEPDCSNWAQLIEANEINRNHITKVVDEVLQLNADIIVLGCTHYHWIEDVINELVQDRASVIQPISPVIEQLKRELARIS